MRGVSGARCSESASGCRRERREVLVGDDARGVDRGQAGWALPCGRAHVVRVPRRLVRKRITAAGRPRGRAARRQSPAPRLAGARGCAPPRRPCPAGPVARPGQSPRAASRDPDPRAARPGVCPNRPRARGHVCRRNGPARAEAASKRIAGIAGTAVRMQARRRGLASAVAIRIARSRVLRRNRARRRRERTCAPTGWTQTANGGRPVLACCPHRAPTAVCVPSTWLDRPITNAPRPPGADRPRLAVVAGLVI